MNNSKPLIASTSFWGLMLGTLGPMAVPFLTSLVTVVPPTWQPVLQAAIAILGMVVGTNGIVTRTQPIEGILTTPK